MSCLVECEQAGGNGKEQFSGVGREQGWAPDQRRGGGGPPRVGPPRRTIKAAAGGARREAGAAGATTAGATAASPGHDRVPRHRLPRTAAGPAPPSLARVSAGDGPGRGDLGTWRGVSNPTGALNEDAGEEMR